MYFCYLMHSIGLRIVEFGYKFSLVVGVGIPPFKAESDFRPNPTAIVKSEYGLTDERFYKWISHVLFFSDI